jgi:L-fuculose-phosphate aldolase
MIDGKLRAEIADYSRRLHARGWVANHDGNISVRVADGRFLCTPTAFSKAEVTPDSLVTVDAAGAAVAGRFRPFSEIVLHLAVYKDRPDVQAVVHAHPPHATALAAAGRGLHEPFLAEAVVSLGPQVPLVPVSAPGPAAVAVLQPFVKLHDAVLVAGNGVFAWGSDLEQAYLRLELVEHLCRIYLLALPAGGVKPLPAGLIPALLESRRKAGLGPEARGITAPPPGPAIPATPAVDAAAGDRLATLIREELAAALRRA